MVGNLLTILSMGLPEAMQAFAKQYGPVFKVTTAMRCSRLMWLRSICPVCLHVWL